MARRKTAKGTEKNSNSGGANLGFESTLWAAADKLRGHMDAAVYKHVVLGLIFLKYVTADSGALARTVVSPPYPPEPLASSTTTSWPTSPVQTAASSSVQLRRQGGSGRVTPRRVELLGMVTDEFQSAR